MVAFFLKGHEVLGLDVGGRETGIFWTGNGGLLASRTVPLGGRAISQHLAEGLYLPLHEAEALKLSHGRHQTGETLPSSVSEMLSGAVATWLAEVERQLMALAGGRDLPHHIHLWGGGSELPELVEAAKAFPWMRELPFARCPEVEVLNPERIPGLLDRTGLSLGRGGLTVMGLARWACVAEAQSGAISRAQIAPAGLAVRQPGGGLQIRREQNGDFPSLPDQLLAKIMRKEFDAFLGGI